MPSLRAARVLPLAGRQFLEQSVSTVLAHSPVLYDQDLTPTQRRACATADSFEELEKVHNDWAHTSGDLSGSTAILSTFQDGVLVMAGVGDSGERGEGRRGGDVLAVAVGPGWQRSPLL